MKFDEQLDVYLRARFTLLVLITAEEERAIQSIKTLCARTQRTCLSWDASDGFQWVTSATGTPPTARDPMTALDIVDKGDNNLNAVYVLKDFHEAWNNPQIKLKLRSV